MKHTANKSWMSTCCDLSREDTDKHANEKHTHLAQTAVVAFVRRVAVAAVNHVGVPRRAVHRHAQGVVVANGLPPHGHATAAELAVGAAAHALACEALKPFFALARAGVVVTQAAVGALRVGGVGGVRRRGVV